MVSPADLRYLKEVLFDFGLEATLLPDYSETLDGPQLDEYRRFRRGTAVESIRAMGRARISLELGRTLAPAGTRRLLSKADWHGPAQTRLAGWGARKRRSSPRFRN